MNMLSTEDRMSVDSMAAMYYVTIPIIAAFGSWMRVEGLWWICYLLKIACQNIAWLLSIMLLLNKLKSLPIKGTWPDNFGK